MLPCLPSHSSRLRPVLPSSPHFTFHCILVQVMVVTRCLVSPLADNIGRQRWRITRRTAGTRRCCRPTDGWRSWAMQTEHASTCRCTRKRPTCRSWRGSSTSSRRRGGSCRQRWIGAGGGGGGGKRRRREEKEEEEEEEEEGWWWWWWWWWWWRRRRRREFSLKDKVFDWKNLPSSEQVGGGGAGEVCRGAFGGSACFRGERSCLAPRSGFDPLGAEEEGGRRRNCSEAAGGRRRR
eukprot:768503-Hanusia_phi.AAC.4